VTTSIVKKDTVVADPPLSRLLFSDRRMAPICRSLFPVAITK